MRQRAIPYLFMRGGSSRGPYFNARDLPEDRKLLAEVLMAAVGAGHPINIDGIGGGVAVTTKVAILSPSSRDDADVDYFFAQVAVEDRLVDFKPTCGNMLCGVASAAVEMGIIKASDPQTSVRIHAVNTGARVHATIETPDGECDYDGAAQIDGVPGTAAPVRLSFMDTVGSATGKLLPTGNAIDVIDGLEVSCVDVAMPIVIARAADLGLTGYETRDELDANRSFYERIEPIRIEAGKRMGMGDVTTSVMPKFAIVSSPRDGGNLSARYFMPWTCHPSMAVTGSQCLAACLLTPGTVADGIGRLPNENPAPIAIEHPSGKIDVLVDVERSDAGADIRSAGLVRTTRLLARGEVMVPAAAWPAHS
jgi:4-oxalomesaconate tautomerase